MNFFRRSGVEIIRSAVIALVISSTFAGASFWQWSNVAGSNSTADPTINWSIGMAPSAVSGSSRAMMAALAKYRDDVSGLLATGGTSTAYTVTTNQTLCNLPTTTPQDGQELAVTIGTTNGIAPTLTADSCSAYPIQSSAGNAVPSATLISGSPYTLKFSVANSAWMLRDFYGSSLTVPLGALVQYVGTTVPNSNFVLPAGQCLSTTTYATLWVLMGSPASGSCSGGQFQIIDMRGRVAAALDNLNGSAANRLTSASTGCGTAMTSVGAVCANGVEGSVIPLAQLPTGIGVTITPGGSYPNIALAAGAVSSIQVSSAATLNIAPATSNANWSSVTSLTGTSNNTSGTARPQVMPTIGITYLLRVL